MKKKILVYIAIVSVFSFNCFAQIVQVDTSNEKTIGNQINALARMMTSSVKTVKTVKKYHVVETVNLKFRGRPAHYNEPDPH